MMEAAPGILNRSVRKEDLVAKACHWQNSQFVLCIVLVHDMQNWFVFCCLSSGKSNKGPKAALCQITQALISEFQGRPGCRNVAKGGEGRTGGMSTVSLYEFVKGPCFVLQGWHAGVIYVCFLFVSMFLVRDVFSSRIFQHHNILETCDNIWVYHLVLLHPFASPFRHIQLQTLLLYCIALPKGPVGRAPYFAYLVVVSCGDGVGILPKRTRRLGPGARPKLWSLSGWFLKVSLELVALSCHQSVTFQILKLLCMCSNGVKLKLKHQNKVCKGPWEWWMWFTGNARWHHNAVFIAAPGQPARPQHEKRCANFRKSRIAAMQSPQVSIVRFAEERSKTNETTVGPHFRMFASMFFFGNFRFHHTLGVLKLHLHDECSTWWLGPRFLMELCLRRFLGSDELSTNVALGRAAGALGWSCCRWLKEKNCANSRMADEAGRPPSTASTSGASQLWTFVELLLPTILPYFTMASKDDMKWHLRLSEFSCGLEARKQGEVGANPWHLANIARVSHLPLSLSSIFAVKSHSLWTAA